MHLSVLPPVGVMRPTAARTLPRSTPGGTLFQPKFDGWRALAFVLDTHAVILQTRSGANVARRFPEILPALIGLPPGTVLDGEITAWREDRLVFGELQRTPAGRAADGVTLLYAAFDQLAEGGVDIRDRTLEERDRILRETLAGAPPQVQPVPSTRDRDEALGWYDTLTAVGFEGIVAKALASRYDPSDTRSWVKLRHSDTAEATIVAVTGPDGRPTGVTVRLDDGSIVTTAKLGSIEAHAVAAAVAGRTGELSGRGRRAVTNGPRVEVTVGSGRHPTVRFVRVRAEAWGRILAACATPKRCPGSGRRTAGGGPSTSGCWSASGAGGAME